MPVYFIRAGEDGPVKIGFSENISERLRVLATSVPAQLRVVRTLDGDRLLEAAFHRMFAKARQRGEWFAWLDEMASVMPLPSHYRVKHPKRNVVITPMPPKLVDRIDREWHKRMLPSRSATIRKLLEEALEK